MIAFDFPLLHFGGMDLGKFKSAQLRAILDLLVLGMYADGHLALAEDARIEQLLATMGFSSDYEREREIDASVTRVRQHSTRVESIRAEITELVKDFPSQQERNEIYALLNELIGSDNEVSRSEVKFLNIVADIFQI
jgi:uncharacterized tellurite resistance protein B-like protein